MRPRVCSNIITAHRFFGFNNPSPAPGSPNYGYEQWMTVGPPDQLIFDLYLPIAR